KYMSPEQAWGGLVGGPIDHRSDIWALGVILCEIASDHGYPYSLGPSDGRSEEEALLYRIRTELPRIPPMMDPQFGPSLHRLIERCLLWDKQFRLQSAGELADEIQRCLSLRKIRTKRLPITFRLHRIFTELAIHRRSAIWGTSVVTTLLLLSILLFAGNVRWWERELSTLSNEMDARLGQARPLAPSDVVIVGITDHCLQSVPKIAATLGLSDVTSDIRTWRAVHGQAMKELARVKPLAVVWDFFFEKQRNEDHLLVEGALALHRNHVPVAFAVDNWEDDGSPQLSQTILNPLRDYAHFGGISARDMNRRPGEFVLVQRRGSNIVPSLSLVAVSAIARQNKQLVIDWQERTTTLTLRYQEDGKETLLPFQDRLFLSKTYFDKVKSSQGVVLAELGLKTYGLHRPELWNTRVIPYSRLLETQGERISETVAGKIVLFGDLRSASILGNHDRHQVRYDGELVSKVPGCFLIADAVTGLSDSRYLRSAFPMNSFTLFVCMALGLLGCALPVAPPLSTSRNAGSPHRIGMGIIAAAYVASCGVMLLSETKTLVIAGICLASLTMTFFFSAHTESVRQRFRVEPQDGDDQGNSDSNQLPDQLTTASAPSTVIPASINADNRIKPNLVTSFSFREIG
ncbi:MAG: CHASE2 domain-containing protein, partial [Planctomycetota bacterium]